MTFFLIVSSIMMLSIYLIYKLTHFFGCAAECRSLFLCAFMAFAVTISAILLSPYLTQDYYIRLGVLIVAAGAIVTVYNERLLRREAAAVSAVSSETVPAEPLPEKASDEMVVRAKVKHASASTESQKPKEANKKPAGKVVAKASHPSKPDREDVKPVQTPKQNALSPPKEKSVQKPSGDVVSSPPKKLGAALETKDAAVTFDSLDSLLDYAFEQRSQGHRRKAISAYRQALKQYSEDPYVPFIAIDLGNIYKESADYDEAIRVYRESLSIPLIAADDTTYREFAKNLSYLRTVQYILTKHNALGTPFQKIPAEYLAEIETMFQERPQQEISHLH